MHSVGNYVFSYSDILGHGAFALVYKGYNRDLKNEPVAIKKIRKSSFSSLLTKERKEIAILNGLKHENIVSMIDFEETVSDIFLVLEFCNLGDLNDLLLKLNKISEDHIRLIFRQVGSAISFLHSLQIIHRDLKPQNILLHSKNPHVELSDDSIISISTLKYINLIAKIGDFGFARVLSETTMATTLCGSPLYMAPEVLLGQSYDSKVDMWSLGTIIYQCFTGFAPFIAKNPQLLRKRYELDLKLQPNLPIQASPQLNSLILALLKRDANVRLGYNEFSHHPFFQPLTLLANFENSTTKNSTSSLDDNILENANKHFLYPSDIVYSSSRDCSHTNLPECNFMFASPHGNIDSSTQISVCSNKHKSESYQKTENKSSLTGFVLLSNCLSDCRIPCSPPINLISFEKKTQCKLSAVDDVPFSGLAPLSYQNDEKPKCFIPDTLIPLDDDVCKTSIYFPPNESNIFDISIIEQSDHLTNKDKHSELEGRKLNLSDNLRNWKFSQENTCLDSNNLQHHSYPIHTMFINTVSEFTVQLFDHIPQELQALNCPYEPSYSTIPDLEILPFENYSVYSTLSSYHNYPIPPNQDYLIHSNSNNFVESERVVLKDLPPIDSTSQSASPCSHFISEVGYELGLIEEYSRTILLCRYIFDTINFITHPFFYSSIGNSSNLSICSKSVSRCDLNMLVLLVKIVMFISNILESNESISVMNNDSYVYERSVLEQHKQVLVGLLVKAKLELDKFNFTYLTTTTNFDFYHNHIISAETLIYKHLVEICQMATLEQVFDRSDGNCLEKYMKANLLSIHLSQTSRFSSFYKIHQFGFCTKDAIFNIHTLL